MEDVTIRPIHPNEYILLEDFLYEAIFIPEGVDPPARSITHHPDLQIYIDDFGSMPADTAMVAIYDNHVIGAAWARIIDDYGHIDNETPSLSISLYPKYRNRGIGTKLLHKLLHELHEKGYRQASLSVQKANPAYKLYQRLGFRSVRENTDEDVMVISLER